MIVKKDQFFPNSGALTYRSYRKAKVKDQNSSAGMELIQSLNGGNHQNNPLNWDSCFYHAFPQNNKTIRNAINNKNNFKRLALTIKIYIQPECSWTLNI